MRLALLLIAGVVYGQTASQPAYTGPSGREIPGTILGNSDGGKPAFSSVSVAPDDLTYDCSQQDGSCVHVDSGGKPIGACLDERIVVLNGAVYQCQSKGWVSNPEIGVITGTVPLSDGGPGFDKEAFLSHERSVLLYMAAACMVALILTAIMGFRLGRASRQREDDQQDRREALMNSNLELKDIPAGGILRIGDLPMYRMELGRKPEVTPDTSYEALMKLYDEDPEEFMRITSMCQSGGAETVKIDEPKTFGEPFRFSEPQDPGEFIPYRKKLYPLPARDSKGRFLPKEKKA